MRLLASLLAGLPLLASHAYAALEVNLDDPASIKAAAKNVATDLLTFYRGDEPGWVPGILPGPPPDGDYYWWQGGAMWGALIDYRHYTGDKDFDDIITQAMLFQVGDDRDYNPRNWSASMGNDDQAFWAISAMIAAENGYTDPPKEDPQWLSLVQAVFNEQSSVDRRVSPQTGGNCEGGLRWQVYPSNNGWDYVNTIANACYFNMGARLARYTGNETYAETAEKTWDFVRRVKYVDDDFNVYDGAHLPTCADINKAQFSYNAAMLIQGSAFLYNMTQNQKWKDAVDGLLGRSLEIFFQDGIGFEPSCEDSKTGCNSDMRSYKGYFFRWLASTMQVAPWTREKIMPVLKTSAAAAVKTCTGGANGRFCGFSWKKGAFDGIMGAGQQMNTLAALTTLLIDQTPPPLTNGTGGTSTGDVNAGSKEPLIKPRPPITGGDRAGAGILTALMIAGCLGAFAWMSTDGIE